MEAVIEADTTHSTISPEIGRARLALSRVSDGLADLEDVAELVCAVSTADDLTPGALNPVYEALRRLHGEMAIECAAAEAALAGGAA
jgi:hypothetical protein